MAFTMRKLCGTEAFYCYSQGTHIEAVVGCIGHLRADMGSDGTSFYSSWTDHHAELKTDQFKLDLDRVINGLRGDPQYGGVLKSLASMKNFCQLHPDAFLDDECQYGFRADTEDYAFLLRLCPVTGEYNVYCYGYPKKTLDTHLKNAEKGIRFVDERYQELFRLPDGGHIRIIGPKESQEYICRYLDDYHFVCNGFVTYHIMEFADRMKEQGNTVEIR